MKKNYENITIDELIGAVNKSNSFTEVTSNLNLDPKNGNIKKNIERLIKRKNINVDHFDSVKRLKNAKLKYNDKELLISLVLKSKTFKNVLMELDLLPIESNYNTLKKYLKLYDINYDHISYNNKRNKARSDYSIENLSNIIITSNSISEVLKKLGLSTGNGNYKTVREYIKTYNIDITHFNPKNRQYNYLSNFNKQPLDIILVENLTYNNTCNLKERLYKEGLKQRKCELCGQDENWHGNHMSLILDHKNGINNDNRIENLRIVCPNCNATLPTHCRGANRIKST